MDYTNLLKRAWHIVWNNKFMFVLGFLAALGSGGGSGGGGNSNFSFPSSGSGNNNIDLPPGFVENIERYWAEFAGVLLALVCFFVILGIVFWLLSLVGQTGLISSAARIDAGEKATLGEAFGEGTSKLGKMVGLNLILYGPFILIGLIAFGGAAVLIGPAMFAEMSGTGGNFDAVAGALGGFFVCFGLLACILVPLGILVNIIYPFAQRGLILQGYGVMDSIRHGWKVVRENVGDVVLLIILFLVIGFVFGIAAAIVLIPLALLIFVPNILSMVNSGTFEVVNILFLIGGGICLGVLGAVINSMMIAYRSTAVTLAYQEFINKSGKLETA